MRIFLFTLIFFTSSVVYAGTFSDHLARCLVKKTTVEDKELLLKWVYAAMSAHPEVQDMSNISVAKGAELNRKTGELFVDLIAIRCKQEAKEAFQYEGEDVFKSSFSVLGRVAMQGLMADKNVSAYMAGVSDSMDSKKLEKVFE